MYQTYKEHRLHTIMQLKQHNQTWTTSTIVSMLTYFFIFIAIWRDYHLQFEARSYLIIKLDIRCISLAHIGIIHTSTHEKLSNSLSCTKIMNHVVQLQSYILDIIPSRSYITLQFLTLFKEELPSLSHNIRT